jgi:hypothetical protein
MCFCCVEGGWRWRSKLRLCESLNPISRIQSSRSAQPYRYSLRGPLYCINIPLQGRHVGYVEGFCEINVMESCLQRASQAALHV